MNLQCSISDSLEQGYAILHVRISKVLMNDDVDQSVESVLSFSIEGSVDCSVFTKFSEYWSVSHALRRTRENCHRRDCLCMFVVAAAVVHFTKPLSSTQFLPHLSLTLGVVVSNTLAERVLADYNVHLNQPDDNDTYSDDVASLEVLERWALDNDDDHVSVSTMLFLLNPTPLRKLDNRLTFFTANHVLAATNQPRRATFFILSSRKELMSSEGHSLAQIDTLVGALPTSVSQYVLFSLHSDNHDHEQNLLNAGMDFLPFLLLADIFSTKESVSDIFTTTSPYLSMFLAAMDWLQRSFVTSCREIKVTDLLSATKDGEETQKAVLTQLVRLGDRLVQRLIFNCIADMDDSLLLFLRQCCCATVCRILTSAIDSDENDFFPVNSHDKRTASIYSIQFALTPYLCSLQCLYPPLVTNDENTSSSVRFPVSVRVECSHCRHALSLFFDILDQKHCLPHNKRPIIRGY